LGGVVSKCIKVLYRAGAKNLSSIVGDNLVDYMTMPGKTLYVQDDNRIIYCEHQRLCLEEA
jgi:hypothetical protein